MRQLSDNLEKRILILRWVIPFSFALLVVVYELGLARWVHDNFSDPLHFAVEILFFGTTGPFLTFWILTRVGRWLAEKSEAERQARASERLLASITNASADAILGLNLQGKVMSWNRGAELLLAYTASEAANRSLAVFLDSRDAAVVEVNWLLQTAREEGYVRGHETTVRAADGRALIVDLTATSLFDDQDEPVGVSLIMHDITNRKQREAEIQRLNANLNQQVAARTRELAEKVTELAQANSELQKLDQTRTEFVSLVSHQIRAPLTNMRGAVERLQASCGVNPTCSHMFTIIEQQTRRLDRLVQDVLDANRLESGTLAMQLEPVSVQPVIRRVLEEMRARLSARPIAVTDTPGLPLVYADRDRLVEVLSNLLDNADKYAPPGTAVTISARADELEVTISVRDRGAGLPANTLERVFDKFYRTDSSDAQTAYGYGLGLYVCRQLVTAQNGRIWAENHPEGGAVFSVALPAWQES